MGFRDNLRDELNYQDIRIKELSDKTGISIGTINHYLAEKSTEPTVENAVKIAKVLNVSVEYLVTGKNPNFKESDESEFEVRLFKKYFSILKKLDSLHSNSIKSIENLLENLK